MPHLIITYGSAGSGKGYIYPKYTSLLNSCYSKMDPITEANTFVAEIDPYVESDIGYKDTVFQIICDFFQACQVQMETKTGLGMHLKTLLSNVVSTDRCSASALSASLTAAYQFTRRKYNAKLNADIAQAVKDNRNIIFETTGQHHDPLNWLWQCGSGPFCQADAYVKTIVYPYVNSKDILKRTHERFAIRVLEWYDCLKACKKELRKNKFGDFSVCLAKLPTQDVPRLPDIHELRTLIPAAQRHIIPYIDNNQVENIIIYDNAKNDTDPLWFNLKSTSRHGKTPEEKARELGFLMDTKNDMAPELRSKLAQAGKS